jgi:hypothetical protein
MVPEPPETEYNQLVDFANRPFQPFLEPHYSPKGITLGPHDPKKLAGLLGKVAAKSKGDVRSRAVKTKTAITHGNKR